MLYYYINDNKDKNLCYVYKMGDKCLFWIKWPYDHHQVLHCCFNFGCVYYVIPFGNKLRL